MKVLFLAHQDDEIFFLPHIMDSDKKLFVYLTNGVSAGATKSKLGRRTIEAELIFEKYLAPLNSQAIWWGLENSIPEGELHRYVSQNLINDLKKIITGQGFEVAALITTAFEGAHQDHDSAAVIARKMSNSLQIDTIEMSTYPQWFSRIYSFKVLKPRIPMDSYKFNRFKALIMAVRMMAGYRTQFRTWLGLGPATLITYIFRTYKSSAPRPLASIKPCFYESRGRASQTEVLRSLWQLE